ncbi:stalk domain-containing protein [Paenibacillus sp. D51F]
MNRLFSKKRRLASSAALLAAVLAFTGSAPSQAAASSPLAPVPDVVKIYKNKHEFSFAASASGAVLDGNKIETDKPIHTNGRIYIPLRTLRQTGAAVSVDWEPKQGQVRIKMKEELQSYWQELVFRIGKAGLFSPQGDTIADPATPAPFLSKGITYVPVAALKYMGISPSYAEGIVRLNWSSKILEKLKPSWSTDSSETTFNVLYEKGIYSPQVMQPLGSGGGGGSTGESAGKDIQLDGRVYDRASFTVKLRPGANLFTVGAISAGSVPISVVRSVSDPASVPVSYTEEGTPNLSLSEPSSGYVKAAAGKPVAISGKLLKLDGFDSLKLSVAKFNKDAKDVTKIYTETETKTVAISKQAFAGSVTLKEPGLYLISVISPNYIPAPGGAAATSWAEVIIEVR